jgi:hypothetical protein
MPAPRATITLSEGGRNYRSITMAVAADEGGFNEFEVANSVTEEDIMPAKVTTGDVLYIESDQAVTYLFSASGDAHTLDPNVGAHMLFGTSFTVLLLTNSSGSTANIKLGVWGT